VRPSPRAFAWLIVAGVAGVTALAGCGTIPEQAKPTLDLPVAWTLDSPWRQATPSDALAKGPWWHRFNDDILNDLQERASRNSPTLEQANARLAQARSLQAAAEAGLFPQVGLLARPARQEISANRPLTNYKSPNFATIQNDHILSMSASYEVDFAGRVQATIDGARATAEQTAADLENLRLLLAADLASAYFNLREIDTEIDVLRRAIGLQERALELITARHDLGAATGLDVAQQKALLSATRVQQELLRRQRGQFEHVIATLIGVPAPQFSLPPERRDIGLPTVPLGIPSDILERRPDVAVAERAMAAANAQIGVANAAFFPSIILNATGGYEANQMSKLFDEPSLIWSFGVAIAKTVFDGGRVKANAKAALAGYQATVANYRKVVLTAMQEVEDGITGLSALERAAEHADASARTAAHVLDMTTARYEGGASSYFEVIAAQQALLTSERQVAQINGQRLVTSVFLIKALGGGWERVPATDARNAAPAEKEKAS